MTNGAVVTGCSGFIGSHLCSLLSANGGAATVSGIDVVPSVCGSDVKTTLVDITNLGELQRVVAASDTVFHLAAKAEVVVPAEAVPELNATNVTGTVNVLRACAPKRFVFASTSAVYGDGRQPTVDPSWSSIKPLGVYGISKAAGELACTYWAKETQSAAIMFRLGNVIGPRCRGLIPHLVRHARKHPSGDVPVRMRANGALTRDYVPVEHVVRLFKQASTMDWQPGTSLVFNIGTGRGMTNGEVAQVVAGVLRRLGYNLTVDASDPRQPDESTYVVLDVTSTTRTFGAPAPSPDVVHDAIERSVVFWLQEASV